MEYQWKIHVDFNTVSLVHTHLMVKFYHVYCHSIDIFILDMEDEDAIDHVACQY